MSPARTGWVGWIYFAGVMMIISGILNAIYGLVAIFSPAWEIASGPNLLLFDLAGWGWLHLVIGIIVLFAGMGIFSGSGAARIVAIIMACISLVGNFLWLPAYPFWSIIIIVVDVLVIWAIIAHGEEANQP